MTDIFMIISAQFAHKLSERGDKEKKNVREISPCSTLRPTSCQKMDDMVTLHLPLC